MTKNWCPYDHVWGDKTYLGWYVCHICKKASQTKEDG